MNYGMLSLVVRHQVDEGSPAISPYLQNDIQFRPENSGGLISLNYTPEVPGVAYTVLSHAEKAGH